MVCMGCFQIQNTVSGHTQLKKYILCLRESVFGNAETHHPIDAYTSADAAALRDKLIDDGLSVSSVKRNFSTIRSIINLTITEQGLDCINAFFRTYMPDDDRQRRLPVPIDCIRVIQSDCHHMDDDMRWLVALLSDTGMRLGEALWAASRAIESASGSNFLFPRYNRGSTSNANSASAAINKWLKPRVPEGCVIHSDIQ